MFAYVDTSCVVAVALREPSIATVSRQLRRAERLFAANILEAEFRAAMFRENITEDVDDYLGEFSWVMPDRPLSLEISKVLEHGYLRGADLWHLACALYLAEDPSSLYFLTLDRQQSKVAKVLGFKAI